MTSQILYFFLLVLGVFLNLALNIVHKQDEISKIFLEKSLKFFSSHRVCFFLFKTKLVLLSLKVDSLTKE